MLCIHAPSHEAARSASFFVFSPGGVAKQSTDLSNVDSLLKPTHGLLLLWLFWICCSCLTTIRCCQTGLFLVVVQTTIPNSDVATLEYKLSTHIVCRLQCKDLVAWVVDFTFCSFDLRIWMLGGLMFKQCFFLGDNMMLLYMYIYIYMLSWNIYPKYWF